VAYPHKGAACQEWDERCLESSWSTQGSNTDVCAYDVVICYFERRVTVGKNKKKACACSRGGGTSQVRGPGMGESVGGHDTWAGGPRLLLVPAPAVLLLVCFFSKVLCFDCFYCNCGPVSVWPSESVCDCCVSEVTTRVVGACTMLACVCATYAGYLGCS
jgi:hypothetical protein